MHDSQGLLAAPLGKSLVRASQGSDKGFSEQFLGDCVADCDESFVVGFAVGFVVDSGVCCNYLVVAGVERSLELFQMSPGHTQERRAALRVRPHRRANLSYICPSREPEKCRLYRHTLVSTSGCP